MVSFNDLKYPILGLVGTGAILYLGVYQPIANEIKQEKQQARVVAEFNQTYHSALWKYANTNEDDFISADEQGEFDRKLLQDKGVTLIFGKMPVSKDGTSVPLEVIIQWIKDYRSAN